MKRIVIGTAGHVDHGKTALIKALTGIDCDRLKVEKERGITTELGFAYYKGGEDLLLGIVDVPGHERFVRHMVSGAWGIDMVLLVVAADEGVMPQTKEHVDICELLGLKKAIVAVTKIDLVDEEMLELVIEDVKDFLKGRPFEKAPIIPVSSVTGQNISLLKSTIMEVAKDVPEKSKEGIFRLPVDRVFSVKGHGTVVTGTCISGSVKVGEQVEIYPIHRYAKVRSIQAYYEERQKAFAGERVALNLQGIDKEELERGVVIGEPGRLIPSIRVDVSLKLLDLPIKPIKSDTILRFHIGTAQREARLIILEKDEIRPGEELFCQFVFLEPIVAMPKDNFIIRGSYFPSQTIGGGVILDVTAKKHKRKRPELGLIYNVLRNGSPKDRLELFVKDRDYEGLSLAELEAISGLNSKELEEGISSLMGEGKVLVISSHVMHEEFVRAYKSKLIEILQEFHERNPLKIGISREELKQRLPKVKDSFFVFVLDALVKEGQLEIEKDRIRHKLKKPEGMDIDSLEREIISRLHKYDLCAPSISELNQELKHPENMLRDFLERLVYEGKVVKLKKDMYIHPESLERFRTAVVSFLKEKGEASPSEIKSVVNISRKYLIPLLEYLDEVKITIRKGDKRVLREISF
ncbi:MAG: selenocysteine-specific translation elongation factor [Desulfobacterota bacterium]|nr:selenocysteine-specific translation elongation factor [Thermodesulfobacteriota bacterium]MDW8001730.1 selenocysteine-specific translation elongation factor [Deltaproteobacteria bacterium]